MGGKAIFRTEDGKACSHCKTFQPWVNFRLCKTKVDGHLNFCMECKKESVRKSGKRVNWVWPSTTKYRQVDKDKRAATRSKKHNEMQMRYLLKLFKGMCQPDARDSFATCRTCGNSFATTRAGQIHCSAKCRGKQKKANIKNNQDRLDKYRVACRERGAAQRKKPAYKSAKAARDMVRYNRKRAQVTGLPYIYWVKQLKKQKHFNCYWCGERLPIGRLHIDHIVPLYHGGVDGIENVCASCDTCNLSKGHTPLEDWARDHGRLAI